MSRLTASRLGPGLAVVVALGLGLGLLTSCSFPDTQFKPTTDASVDGQVDARTTKPFGWPPPPFTSSSLLAQGSVVAYKITIDATARNLDAFGVYVPAGAGFYRMALYRDAGNAPGARVAEMAAPVALSNGANLFDLLPDAALDTSIGVTFWIAFRISQNTAVGYSTTSMGSQCYRSQDIPNINDPWPTLFGTASCQNDYLMNFWITTYP